MEEKIEYNIKSTVDIRGKHCPVPMLSSMKALKQLDIGEQIEVLATDNDFCMDVNALVRAKKCSILYQEKREDHHYFVLEKV